MLINLKEVKIHPSLKSHNLKWTKVQPKPAINGVFQQYISNEYKTAEKREQKRKLSEEAIRIINFKRLSEHMR